MIENLENMEIIAAAVGVLGVVAGAGTTWGASRARLARTEEDVLALTKIVGVHQDEDTAQHTSIVQRLTRIETLLTTIDSKL